MGAAYRQVSRKEAGMRFLLMQMANAATRQVSDPDRGLELLGTALTSLHTVLTTLRSSPPVEGAATAEASAAVKADLLRLSPAVQEAYGLLALPVPAAVKYLIRPPQPTPVVLCSCSPLTTGNKVSRSSILRKDAGGRPGTG